MARSLTGWGQAAPLLISQRRQASEWRTSGPQGRKRRYADRSGSGAWSHAVGKAAVPESLTDCCSIVVKIAGWP